MLKSLNQKNLYRGPSSSKEFNERNKFIRDDINNMYQLLNENEKNIEKNMDIVLRENFFLSYEIKNLYQEIKKLKELITDEPDGLNQDYYKQIHVQNFYTTKGLTEASDDRKASINREFGIAMPSSTDSISRFGYHTDSGEVFVPNSLEIHLKEGNDTHRDEYGDIVLEEINLEDTIAIVDGNKNTFWTRTVIHPTHEAVHEVHGELHIIIPTEGFQNIYTNTLKIRPYPEASMRIHDITYKGYNDQWSRLETYPVQGSNPVAIDNAHKMLFQFPDTEMIELKIRFSQPYWFEDNNQSHFTYGFQDISLEYHNYTEKICEFITTMELDGDNLFYKKILRPIPSAAIGSSEDLTDMVEFELYYDESLSMPFTFGSDILTDINKVYIKTLLKKDGPSIPVLKEINIPYYYHQK